jgi:hypothetical protein
VLASWQSTNPRRQQGRTKPASTTYFHECTGTTFLTAPLISVQYEIVNAAQFYEKFLNQGAHEYGTTKH